MNILVLRVDEVQVDEMVRVERLFARWYAFRTATSRPYNLTTSKPLTLKPYEN